MISRKIYFYGWKQTCISVLIGLLIVSVIDNDWIDVEGLGIISGNWTVVGTVLIGICFILWLVDDDDDIIVIDRVIDRVIGGGGGGGGGFE